MTGLIRPLRQVGVRLGPLDHHTHRDPPRFEFQPSASAAASNANFDVLYAPSKGSEIRPFTPENEQDSAKGRLSFEAALRW